MKMLRPHHDVKLKPQESSKKNGEEIKQWRKIIKCRKWRGFVPPQASLHMQHCETRGYLTKMK